MRHSCSNFWVSDIGNLPQGDPASPLGLLCCLVEALARIKNQFPDGPEFGKTLHRMYLDDRSWFCSRQSTCLQIARAWKTEAERLGLDESQNKAEFAVVSSSPAKARKELTEALQAENLPGRVVSRPKILGSRINTMRNESSSVKEETERLQRAKLASQCIQRLPLHRRKKLMFAKGAAVSLVATPVMQRLPTLLAMKTIQTQITKCGNGTKGHLARLLQGHTACLNFQAGKVTTLFTLLQCRKLCNQTGVVRQCLYWTSLTPQKMDEASRMERTWQVAMVTPGFTGLSCQPRYATDPWPQENHHC